MGCSGSREYLPDGNSENQRTYTQHMLDFHHDCLNAHNAKRALHGSPPLLLASDLSEYSQKWAEHLVSKNKFEHSQRDLPGTDTEMGENLATSSGDMTGEEVVELWYDEIINYTNYASGEFSTDTGHFTQLVWKESRELGVGKAMNRNGETIVCCNYRPAGNVTGLFPENVLPPQ